MPHDPISNDEQRDNREYGLPVEHGQHLEYDRGTERGHDDNRGAGDPFLTLRDHVRLATPVHPPSDPAADQRRRSASLRRLLSLFTGQDYGQPEDLPEAAGSTTAAGSGDGGDDEVLGAWRDGDSAGLTGSPEGPGTRGVDSGSPIQGTSSRELSTSDAPMHWDQPLAYLGGSSFTMPNVLPSALPSASRSDAVQPDEFWLAGDSQVSSESPAARDRGSANSAANMLLLNPRDLPTALGASNPSGILQSDATGGSFPSALKDESLAKQLASPAESLPTALPPSEPESPASDSMEPMESTEADDEGSFDPGASSETGDSDATATSPGMPPSQDSPARSSDSASSGSVSSSSGGGLSISLEIADLPNIMATAAQAGIPGFQAAAREVAAPLSSSVDTAIAQIKDINSRFDEHQLNELMKWSQLRAIYG